MQQQRCHGQAREERQASRCVLKPESEEHWECWKRQQELRRQVLAWATFPIQSAWAHSFGSFCHIGTEFAESYLVHHTNDEALLLNLVGFDSVVILENLAYKQEESEQPPTRPSDSREYSPE